MIRRWLTIAIALGALAAAIGLAPLQPGPAEAPAGVRFAWVDLYVDAGDAPIAAYQLELAATAGDVTIVGIEGGDHRAFAEPPYYDPMALRDSERVVLGAFDTGDDLPAGRTRVARVHVRLAGPAPTYDLTLTAAATAGGTEIDAEASLIEGSAE